MNCNVFFQTCVCFFGGGGCNTNIISWLLWIIGMGFFPGEKENHLKMAYFRLMMEHSIQNDCCLFTAIMQTCCLTCWWKVFRARGLYTLLMSLAKAVLSLKTFLHTVHSLCHTPVLSLTFSKTMLQVLFIIMSFLV